MAKNPKARARAEAKEAKRTAQNQLPRITEIEPLTRNQARAFHAFHDGSNMFLHGVAGSGKTFIAMALALKQILDGFSYYQKLVIVRSAVQSRDQGFLPGNHREKMKEYETPYIEICTDLFGRGDAYLLLKNKGVIEFTSTSFVRGCTYNDCIVLLDEIQNYNWHEISSVLTRVGRNCRIICSGDFRQSDLDGRDKSGIKKLIDIAKNMKAFSFIEFEVDDIVRSQFVKEFIVETYRYEDRQRQADVFSKTIIESPSFTVPKKLNGHAEVSP